ncbi:unnamed protein product, partial [Rotaria sp. Silwood2]
MVATAGICTILGLGYIDTYGRVYNGTFDEYGSSINMITNENYNEQYSRFNHTVFFEARKKYITIATSYEWLTIGEIFIYTSGSSLTNFARVTVP